MSRDSNVTVSSVSVMCLFRFLRQGYFDISIYTNVPHKVYKKCTLKLEENLRNLVYFTIFSLIRKI